LHSVAHAQDGNAQIPDFGIAVGRTLVIDRAWPTRQDDPFGAELADLLWCGAIAQHFGIDLGFADAAGYQLGILRTKVQNDDHLACEMGGRLGGGREGINLGSHGRSWKRQWGWKRKTPGNAED
jgi:hypothetical protein